MPQPAPGAVGHCPLCGEPNRCALAAGGGVDAPCWCRSGRIPAATFASIPLALHGKTCLCPGCSEIEPTPAADETTPCIGVFDSGVGGLTVLAALRRQLPKARFIYAADSAFAPYGERDAAYVLARSQHLTRFLLRKGADIVVVACNTATALAIANLRQQWLHTPFIGIEPAIKPALAHSAPAQARTVQDRSADNAMHVSHSLAPIGVLATPGTLASAKFQALLQSLGGRDRLVLQPCPGLAEAIETLGPQARETLQLLTQFCAPLRSAHCKVVVLGCTHYPLVATALRAALGPGGSSALLLDPADAVATQTRRVLAGMDKTAQLQRRHVPPRDGDAAPEPIPTQTTDCGVELTAYTNGDPAQLLRIAAACGLADLAVRTLA